MKTAYELGVKLALETLKQTQQSQTLSFKSPKVEKPKSLPKPKEFTPPATENPQATPTSSPDTGPYGFRYGGRGTSVRNVG